MRKKPPEPRTKPHFCHDENLEFLQLKKRCNQWASFKSVISIMGKQGAKDPEIIKNCNKEDYHIITHNTGDFRKTYPNISIGILCIGAKDEENWINKFIKLIKKLPKHKHFFNKTILISNTITIKDRSTGETEVL